MLTLWAVSACGDPPPATDGQVEGTALAEAMVSQVERSIQLTAPYRCARIQDDRVAPTVPGMQLSMEGVALKVDSASDKRLLQVAFVSDAHGAEQETLTAVAALRQKFVEQEVDIVVSLGGQASKRRPIVQVLSALSTDAPYLTVAMPGDRESVRDHREAVAELAASGVKIIDGAQYRVLDLGAFVLATMPGISKSSNLLAADEGCLHTAQDTEALLGYLGSTSSRLVLASYAPIRQRGPGASDLGAGAIHVGESVLTPLTRRAAASVIVHGLVRSNDADARGKARWDQAAVHLSAAALDPLEGPSTALILSLSNRKLQWRRVAAP